MPPAMRRATSLLVALLLTLSLVASPVRADEPTPVEQRLAELEKRLADLERLLALSTLNLPALVEKTSPSVVSLYQVTEKDDVISQGSGFLWSADGLIITNAHVVDLAKYKVVAKFTDGKVLPAERVMVDHFLDLAVLKVQGSDFPHLKLATERPAVGAPVVVIGNAFGYSNSVTYGIVSGIDRPSPYHRIVHYPSLQTDAAINSGNSGGPILNAAGEVVAVATWTEGKGESDSIAFGIPADLVARALAQLDPERGFIRPWLGIAVQEPYWARGGLPNSMGLMVHDLHASGAGAKAGLKPYDYIMAVGGVRVNYLLELRQELERYRPGEQVTILVERLKGERYERLELVVTLGEFSQKVGPLVPTLRYDPYYDDIF